MAAYLVAHLKVTDPEGFEAYRDRVPALVEKFGGRYLVRGGQVHPVEGDWNVPRLVIIEFEELEAAQRFYDSPEYQELLPLRLRSSEATLVFVEGVV